MSQRGRREARGARWPGRGGAAFPAAAAALAWAARGLGEGPAAGRRPRAAALSRGPTDGQGRGSCQRVAGPLRWRNLLFLPRLAGALLCLSVLLTLSLPGWKFPLTSSEKTDRGTHARTPRGREVGSPPGVGEARTSGAAVRPRFGPAAQLRSRPSGLLRGGERGARSEARTPESPAEFLLPGRRSRSPEGWSGLGRPLKRHWGPIAPGSRRRGGCGVWLLDSGGPEPLRTGPSTWRG